MIYSNVTVSNQEQQREFFDCPNCWGYQQYESEYRSRHVDADESNYNGYVHMRTTFDHVSNKEGAMDTGGG